MDPAAGPTTPSNPFRKLNPSKKIKPTIMAAAVGGLLVLAAGGILAYTIVKRQPPTTTATKTPSATTSSQPEVADYSKNLFQGIKTISLTGYAPQGLAVDQNTGLVYVANNGEITTKCSNGQGGAGATTALAPGGKPAPPTNPTSGNLPPPNSVPQGAAPPIQGNTGTPTQPGANTLSVVDPAQLKEIRRVDSSGSPIWPYVDSVGGKVYMASSKGYVDQFSLSGDKLQSFNVGGTPHDVGLDPTSGLLLASNTYDTSGNYYSVINVKTNTVAGHYQIASMPHQVVMDLPHHTAYMVTVSDGTMAVIDTTTGQIKSTFSTGTKSYRGTNLMGFSAAERKLFVAEGYSGTNDVLVIDVDKQSVVGKITTPTIPWGMAVDDSRHLLYVALPEIDAVDVINIDSQQILEKISVDTCPYAVRIDTKRGLGFSTSANKNVLSMFSLGQVDKDIQAKK